LREEETKKWLMKYDLMVGKYEKEIGEMKSDY